ncbi:MAG TPA: exosortase H-associated membrane protein, partial [Blastocatellia bacterium]
RWLRLLVLALVVYLVLLPLWWATLDQVAAFTATLADWVYRLFDPLVTINPDGKVVRVFARAPDQSGFSKSNPYQLSLRMDTVTYGMPMFAALVLVTRADSVLAKARGLLIGLAAMTFLTVLAVMMWAKLASVQLDERLAQAGATRSAFFYYTFHGYAFSQPVAAVGIWLALVMLGMFKTRIEKEKPTAVAVARNALCPCGSGRKYKRCCGTA